MSFKDSMSYIPLAGPMPRPAPSPSMIWYDCTLPIFWDGSIIASNYTCDVNYEMYDWLKENIKRNWKVYNRTFEYDERRKNKGKRIRNKTQLHVGHLVIYFRKKEDAMAFKLRWM